MVKELNLKFWLLLFIFLTANGVLPGGSGNRIRHNKQITHIPQNNTTIKRNTAHKTTHTIKDTLHRINTNSHIVHESVILTLVGAFQRAVNLPIDLTKYM
jgi:hypothetical protein